MATFADIGLKIIGDRPLGAIAGLNPLAEQGDRLSSHQDYIPIVAGSLGNNWDHFR